MAKKDPSLNWSDTPRYKKLKKYRKFIDKYDSEFIRDFRKANPGVKPTKINLRAWEKSIWGWIPAGVEGGGGYQQMFEDQIDRDWAQHDLETKHPGEAKSGRRAAQRNIPTGRGMSPAQLERAARQEMLPTPYYGGPSKGIAGRMTNPQAAKEIQFWMDTLREQEMRGSTFNKNVAWNDTLGGQPLNRTRQNMAQKLMKGGGGIRLPQLGKGGMGGMMAMMMMMAAMGMMGGNNKGDNSSIDEVLGNA